MDKQYIDYRRIRICLDNLENSQLSGRIYNVTLKEPIIFHDFGKMIIDVDTLFEEIGAPQSFQKRRTFGQTKEKKQFQYHKEVVMNEDEFYKQKGKLYTFDFVVKSRLHTGMQGVIYDVDGNRIGLFENEMELLKKILEITNLLS